MSEGGLPPPGATRGQRIALLVGLLAAAWIALELFASVLLPFVAAASIAYFLDPPARRLVALGMPRGLAALLLILALIAIALLFALLFYPLIVNQFGLLIGRLPDYALLLQELLNKLVKRLQIELGHDYISGRLRELISSQAGAMISFLAAAISRLIGSGFALFSAITLIVVTPVVAFYLLRDWPRILDAIDSWLPHRYRDAVCAQVREIDRILSAWLRGQAICSLLLGLYYALALTLVGLDLGLIVGFAAGLLSFIPYVGTIGGFLASVALAAAQFSHWSAELPVIAVFVVGNLLENYVIYPRFLGDRVELPAAWVIFALFAGGAAFGFLGVLLAVPVAATVGVLARFWLHRYLASPLYLDPGPRDPPASSP